MRKLWKGMFMTPHLWESIYMAYRAGYDAVGGMLMGRGGEKGELMQNPVLWTNVQEAPLTTGKVSVIKDNGQQKLLGGEIAKDVNEAFCPSYFARDHISKQF